MQSCRTKRVGTSKVKTGCKTCKIGKVKCDEGRPACHRCVGTGRVCDGYGIWGDGGNSYSSRQRLPLSKIRSVGTLQPPPSLFTITSNTEERSSLEWFRCKTVTKLPGSYVSDFWTTLLLQASLREPAVLHAVLSLSSTHEKGVRDTEKETQNGISSRRPEHFSIEHYVKAMSHLRLRFLAKGREDVQVALIACIVFISLELFRGNIQTAQLHLQNGLKILQEHHMIQNKEKRIFDLVHSLNSTEEWILEAFTRLYLQVALFKHSLHLPCLGIGMIRNCDIASNFHSVKEAWQDLQQLLIETLHLTDCAREQHHVDRLSQQTAPPRLSDSQERIKRSLSKWLVAYETFQKNTQACRSADEGKACYLLSIYHTMTNIMLDTSLDIHNELVYDLHTDQFVLLLEQLDHLREAASESSPLLILPGRLLDLSRSVVDFGWIPPLYYVACKCRVLSLRLQAIKLLQSCSHREGFWDAKTATCIVKKVVEIEQGSLSQVYHTAGDSPQYKPAPQELFQSPALPDSCRIRNIEIILSDAVADRILLTYKKEPESPTEFKTYRSEYIGRLERWIEA